MTAPTPALEELNARWWAAGKPHAEAHNGAFRWFCPGCGERGAVSAPLFVAMSDALVHKRDCLTIE